MADKSHANPQKKTNETTDIIAQLTQFGYEKEDIESAMQTVNNPKDINTVMEAIETQNKPKSEETTQIEVST